MITCRARKQKALRVARGAGAAAAAGYRVIICAAGHSGQALRNARVIYATVITIIVGTVVVVGGKKKNRRHNIIISYEIRRRIKTGSRADWIIAVIRTVVAPRCAAVRAVKRHYNITRNYLPLSRSKTILGTSRVRERPRKRVKRN